MVETLVPTHLVVWEINFQLHDQQVETHAKSYSRKSPLRNSLFKREQWKIVLTERALDFRYLTALFNKMLIFFLMMIFFFFYDISFIYIRFSGNYFHKNCNSYALRRFLKVDNNFWKFSNFPGSENSILTEIWALLQIAKKKKVSL